MSKKKITILIGIIILIVLVALYFIIGNNHTSDAIKFKNEYEKINGTTREKDGKTIRSIKIPKKNPMIYAREEDILKMMDNKESFLVYFGFNDCPWCRSVVPTLIECANDLGLDKIYYVDVKKIRDVIELNENGELETTIAGSDGYYKLIERLSPILSDYTIKDKLDNQISTGEKRIFAPNVVAIVNGEATQLTEGISEKQTDGYMELTDEMKDETYQNFKCIIKCILDAKTTCDIKKQC